MMAVEHPFPADLLTQSPTARLSYFRTLTIGHPALRAAYEELRCAIRDAAPGSLILVSGPAGVGKTTLLQRTERELTEELLPELAADMERVPVVRLEAVAPEAGSFNWKDYFRRLLLALAEPMVDRKIITAPARPAPRSHLAVLASPHSASAKLRFAAEQALHHRRPLAVMVDDAQHLATISSGRKLLDQLNTIKSVVNLTRTTHVLAGTYELLAFRNLSGQLSRRSIDVPLRRYRDFRRAATLQMRTALEAALTEEPPPSVRQLARRTHRCLTTLYRHAPALCQRLAARRLEDLARRAAAKREAAYQEIRQVVARLHAEGIYHSQCRVESALSAPYFMGHEEGRTVYREAKRELGISM